VLMPPSTVASLYDNRGTITGESKAMKQNLNSSATQAPKVVPARPVKAAHSRAIHARALPPIRQQPTISPVYAASVAPAPAQIDIHPAAQAQVYQPQTNASSSGTRGFFAGQSAPTQAAGPSSAPSGSSLGGLFAPAKRSTYGERGFVVSGATPPSPPSVSTPIVPYAPQPRAGAIY
jgi:hypothetical protein